MLADAVLQYQVCATYQTARRLYMTITLEAGEYVGARALVYKGQQALINAISDDALLFDGKGIITIS